MSDEVMNWTIRPLGELTENFDSVRIPVKESERRIGPFPYYGASGIVDHVDGYLFDGEYLLIAEDGENLRTQKTPVAFMARGRFWVNNHAHIVRGNSDNDTRFLMYALQEADIAGYLTGSTMPKLTQGNMNRIPVIAPPLAEQRAIARVLGALDDKMELNRRLNRSLEELAQAVFRSWFVDFDPVTAKASGRPPVGLDPATAALFPDHFQDSELGEIPKGWRATRWDEIATLEYGKSLRDYTERKSGYRVFGTNGPIGWHDQSLCPTAGIIVGRKGAYRGVHFSPRPFFVIDTAFYLKPRIDFDLRWAYYELLAADINSQDSGSAIPSTSRDDVYRRRVCLPSDEVLKAFGAQTRAWFSMIDANDAESDTLAAARDALLPPLLSGELRVPDAERFVERLT